MTDAYAPLVSSEPIEGQPLPPTIYQPTPERDRIDQEAGYYEASRGMAFQMLFEDAKFTDRALGFIGADNDRAFQAQRNRMFGATYGTDAPLTVEEANSRYGVSGRLTFDKPISAPMAAWRQGLAQRDAFTEQVVANSDIGPLETIGASIAGSILDPIGLPLWAVPELATGRALRSGALASRLGRLGAVERGVLTGATEGVAGSLVYEGANLWLHHEAADDYDFGDASANVIFGGLLGGVAGGLGGWFEGRKPARAPRVVEALSEDGRTGAFAQAFGDMIEDRPVNLGPSLARTAEVGRLTPPDSGFTVEYGVTTSADGVEAPVFYIRPTPELAEAEGLGLDDMIFGWVEPDRLRIERSNLSEGARGRGLGTRMYERAAAEAEARGLRLVSDREVSPSAQRIWRRIEQTRGAQVNASAVIDGGAADGMLRTADGSAVFTLDARAPSAVASEAPAKTRTQALLDATAAWVAREGDDAAPAAAAAQSASRAARSPAAEGAKAPAARRAKPKVAKGETPPMPKGEPFADPEVAALAADTEAMLAREGLTAPQGAEPQTVADAVLAGAQCLMRSAA
jgi:hypothetical protein